MSWQRVLAIVSVLIPAVYAAGCAEEKASVKLGPPSSPGTADEDDSMADAGAAPADGGGASSGDASAAGDAANTPAPKAADYAEADNWLCRPDNADDACDVDLDTTIVNADGTLEVEEFEPAADPAIDCFYVYPTVSLDETPNSDLVPGAEEEAVVRAQFARFASQCRLFAPMYRQVTLTALRARLAGMGDAMPADPALGYNDVLAAWRHYLENDNDGRGVVLVGHSQGSSVLTRLIKEEIDPDPTKVPLLSAMLIGTNITVPEGEDVGGSFKNIPVCRAADELGCVISYVTFRADAPPPADALFGNTSTEGQEVVCANPAALGGGSAELHAYLSKDGAGASAEPMGPWLVGEDAEPVETPFVSVPGLLSAECKSGYLALTVNSDSEDQRVDAIVGDVVTNGEIQAGWGLHLIDVHVAMGDLIEVVKAQAAAFAER